MRRCPARGSSTPPPSVETSCAIGQPAACPRYNVRLAVWLIGLLFDEPGSELEVHALLDGGALVVGDVDLACQLDEFAVERLLRLLAADAILDVPQALVHLLQRALVLRHVEGRAAAIAPRPLQQVELEP